MFTQMFTRRSLTAFALSATLAASMAGAANAQTPAPGAAPKPAVTAPPIAPPTAPTVVKPAVQPVLDLNTADKASLEKLRGVGPARADAIIKGRPYKGKDELVEKNILPKSVYDGIKDEIVARQKN